MRNLGWIAVGDPVSEIQEVGDVVESDAGSVIEIRRCDDLTGVEIVDYTTGEPVVDGNPTTFTIWDSVLVAE